MEFHSHEIFDNRYELKEQLGRGSFGEVWLAHDTIAGIDVAIKIYIALDNRGLADFRNEYQSVYEVEHPNILKPMHIDVWNRQPYLVMHYCPTSCESLIGQVSEDEIWRFIEDVSSGLSYLHGHDIIHRDIKPDNILRDPHGNYLLTDFGMSKRLRSSLRRNSTRAQQDEVSGSLSYMGPELFESKPEAVKATDIWALGVTIYEMLTGELPFLGQGGVMQKNGADVPELPETYSYGLRKLVYDCLQKNPWERPMASKLIDYKGLKGPGPETPKKQIINSRLIKGAIFGLSAILLVGLVIWWNGRHEENGHEWVDLGLSVKWATCNVGASSPSDYGSYYAWGETRPKSDYSWSTLKYCSDTTGDSFTKYNTESKYGSVDNKTRLDRWDDAARRNWGGQWRMPTDAEWTELRNSCTWTWTTQGGHNGYKVTSKKNGNSIFLPAAGGRCGSSLDDAGSDGDYWSSSLNTDITYCAWYVYFDSSDVYRYDWYRHDGFSVRPVLDKD